MSPPLIIAHRGVRNELPENTKESIEAAIALPNIAGVEFDVELADVPCVLHQETMVPNQDFTKLELASRNFESRDWVGENRLEKISKLDAGSYLDSRFENFRVPTLSEILECNWNDKTAFMELKDPTYWSEKDLDRPKKIVNAVSSMLKKFKGNMEVISFNPDILYEMSIKFPKIPRVFALWYEWQDKQEDAINEARRIGAATISMSDRMLLAVPSWVDKLHNANIKIHIYPVSPAVDEPEHENWTAQNRISVWEELASLKVDAIISDFPRELLAYFSEDEEAL